MSTLTGTPQIERSLYQLLSQAPGGATYLAEAEFGLSQVAPYIAALPSGSRILEVGSGPCIALSTIARERPDLEVHAIEPMSAGFAHFRGFIDSIHVKLPNMHLFERGYEEFPVEGAWDLIYLVNVFEHLPDWRHFLRFVRERLAFGGKCIVLCPNYGFPYESHFRIPVVLNKGMTYKVFSDRILEFERRKGLSGLYSSLNFVKLADVRRSCRELGMTIQFDISIIRKLVDRLDVEPEFAERQKLIAPFAVLLRKTGLLDVLLSLRLIQNYLPYMQIVLQNRK